MSTEHILLSLNCADMLGSSLSSSCTDGEERDAACYTCGGGFGSCVCTYVGRGGGGEEGGVSLSL